jgi:hypothetical protein
MYFRLVNSADRDRIPDSVEEFRQAIRLLSESYPSTNIREIPVLMQVLPSLALSKLTLPCSRLATKQDMPNAMSPSEVQNKFLPVPSPSVSIVGTSLNQSLTEGVLPEALRWLLESVENARTGKPPPPSPTEDPRSPVALAVTLDSWLERAESGPSAARFIRQFQTLSLPEWDHYTHIRIVYSMLSAFGRHKGQRSQIFFHSQLSVLRK